MVQVMSLAYVLGVKIFEQKYVVPTIELDRVSAIMKFICSLNLLLAFVGCVFVKCDISHILCLSCVR